MLKVFLRNTIVSYLFIFKSNVCLFLLCNFILLVCINPLIFHSVLYVKLRGECQPSILFIHVYHATYSYHSILFIPIYHATYSYTMYTYYYMFHNGTIIIFHIYINCYAVLAILTEYLVVIVIHYYTTFQSRL